MERAALSLAASALSSIFCNLGDKAASYFGGDITEKELDNLNSFIIPRIKVAIKMGEAIHVDELKPWLMALRAAAYEAEDVLDMYEYKHLQAKVSPLPNSLKNSKDWAKSLFAPVSLKTKLKKSMEKLQQYAFQAEKFISTSASINLAALEQQRPHAHTVSTVSSKVLGRDQERDFLVNLLISVPDHEHSRSIIGHVPVVAIHGIGGAGKTTLAQYVYNDSRVARFGNRMWVHVSCNFDELKVTREIIESVTREGEHNNLNSLDVLQQKLKDILVSKRFLLVLDDVWCDDKIKWDQMLIPLNEVGDIGSRILITTRTKEVASKLGVDKSIPLNELQSEQYWSLFKHYAFGDAQKHIDDPILLEVAEQIVKKLSNSPLAARMVGSILNRKTSVDSWKMILKEDMMNGTFDALLLSFQHLPPHLQRCFALCSLYPKGFSFEDRTLDDLVRLWIAQGFVEIQNKNEMTVEEKGKQYFDDLASHSFFQENPYGGYVIHDLLHDLAEKVSKDHCFRIEADELITIPSTVMHLSINTYKLSLHVPNILKLVNLRTYINFDESDIDFNDVVVVKNKMFGKLTKLRVIHVGPSSTKSYKLELHGSIGQLKHRRFLQFRLHGVNKFPNSLGALYHLQFLIMDGDGSIDAVPKGFHNLINLRHVIEKDYEKSILLNIPLFGKLTSLQRLALYRANENKSCGIGQLKNLQELRGSLKICSLEKVKDKTDSTEASLKDKKHIEELNLSWGYSAERNDRIDEEILEGLEPPPNLKILKINGFKGVRFPRWMKSSDKFLSNLQSLRLSSCNKLHTLPPLGQLRLLRNLSIGYMPAVEKIGPELYGNNQGIGFPMLEILEFLHMENWVQWCGANNIELFPRLQDLPIIDCPKLLQVPNMPLKLKKLRIKRCNKLTGMISVSRNLEEFYITDWPEIETLLSRGGGDELFPCLRILRIESCSNLIQIRGVSLALEELKIDTCENLYEFCHPLPQSLRFFEVSNCSKLMQLFPLPSSVRILQVRNCPELMQMFPLPSGIKVLEVRNCPELMQLFPLPSGLKVLEVRGCPKLIKMSPFPCGLETMDIENCPGVEALLSNALLLWDSEEEMQQSQSQKQEKGSHQPFSLKFLYIKNCAVSEEKNFFINLDGLTFLYEITLHGLPWLTCRN